MRMDFGHSDHLDHDLLGLVHISFFLCLWKLVSGNEMTLIWTRFFFFLGDWEEGYDGSSQRIWTGLTVVFQACKMTYMSQMGINPVETTVVGPEPVGPSGFVLAGPSAV